MNILDGIILIVLCYSLFSGFRSGVVAQLFSVVGVVLAIWLGSLFGGNVIAMLGWDSSTSKIWGFLITFVLVLIGAAILSRTLRVLVRFVGLGIVDNILGMALSLAKYLIIISILFTSLIGFNNSYKLFSDKDLRSSRLFYPIASLSEYFPVWEWISDAGFDELHDSFKDSISSMGETKKSGKWIEKEL